MSSRHTSKPRKRSAVAAVAIDDDDEEEEEEEEKEYEEDEEEEGEEKDLMSSSGSGDGSSHVMESNIAHLQPYQGMKLEIRDFDWIWSCGYVRKVMRKPKPTAGRRESTRRRQRDHEEEEEEDDDRQSYKRRKVTSSPTNAAPTAAASTKKSTRLSQSSSSAPPPPSPPSSSVITEVVVASDGWGERWDETIVWPSERLAQLYTFTKRVKCFVDCIPVSKRSKPTKREIQMLPDGALARYSGCWPVAVQFRMPHPGVKRGEKMLRDEDKVFVQPYGVEYMPKHIQQQMGFDDGCWYNHGRLRQWRKEPEMMGILPENFRKAFELALADQSVKGYLQPKALQKCALLRDHFRVHSPSGVSIKDGQLRETEVPYHRNAGGGKRGSEEDEDGGRAGEDGDGDVIPSVVTFGAGQHHLCTSDGEAGEDSDGRDKLDMDAVDPPVLPPPMIIKTPLYPRATGIRRHPTQKGKWVGSVSISGNPVFLGDQFSTQTQAYIATQKAALAIHGGQNNNNGESDWLEMEMPKTLEGAQLMDLHAVSMESVIDTYDRFHSSQSSSASTAGSGGDSKERKSHITNRTFSVHGWGVDLINHQCYKDEEEQQLLLLQQQQQKEGATAEATMEASEEDVTSTTAQATTTMTTPLTPPAAAATKPLFSSKERKNKRKLKYPRRVDLENQVYFPTNSTAA